MKKWIIIALIIIAVIAVIIVAKKMMDKKKANGNGSDTNVSSASSPAGSMSEKELTDLINRLQAANLTQGQIEQIVLAAASGNEADVAVTNGVDDENLADNDLPVAA